MKILLPLVLVPLFAILGQDFTPKKFLLPNPNFTIADHKLVQNAAGELLMYWKYKKLGNIYYSKSSDGGLNWSTPQLFPLGNSVPNEDYTFINSFLLPNGNLLTTYRGTITGVSGYAYVFVYRISTDNGNTWSEGKIIPFGSTSSLLNSSMNLSISQTNENKTAFVFNRTAGSVIKGVYALYLTDDSTWSEVETIDANGLYGSLAFINNKDFLAYQEVVSGVTKFFLRSRTNSSPWSDRVEILSDNNISSPKLIKGTNNELFIYYIRNDATPFTGIQQSEIYYIKSTNEGVNWSAPTKFTNYAGKDSVHTVTLINNKIFVSFLSSRGFVKENNNESLYYGSIPDNSTPPFIYKNIITPSSPTLSDIINVKVFADDDQQIDSVKLDVYVNQSFSFSQKMFDDGMHNDSLANDKIYGTDITGFQPGDAVSLYCKLYDNQNNMAELFVGEINYPFNYENDLYLLNVNRLKIRFNKSGVIADAIPPGGFLNQYDEASLFFSGGFFLTGKNGENLWVAGLASADRTEDFVAGNVGSSPNDFKYQLYSVKADNTPFGQSWQNYSYAVQVGAKFYDGDNDGVYNPVDLNGNGIWDLNEDRPDIIGDEILFCVYNDGVAPNNRRFTEQYPHGVEVKQTVFAIGNNITGPIQNMFFVRYIFENKGTVTSEIDSVYFTAWSDIDIGDYVDDVTGCDTLLNLGYGYNRTTDQMYGSNCPAAGITILQGPVVYIPGETFIDNNNNGIYDPGIDTPIDTAFNNNGLFIGSNVFPGAKNLGMTSYVNNSRYFTGLSPASNSIETRYYSLGLNSLGNLVNPCDLSIGGVFGGVNCNQVNPRFLFSGNPYTNFGWLQTTRNDQRIRVNSGPFKLKVNEPVEICVAYVAGRGEDSLASVNTLKENTEFAHRFYRNNFFTLPNNIQDEEFNMNFYLYQNYPNPFNPNTSIKWHSPISGLTTLKIYNILGQEITTLVNEFQFAGSHSIEFDASKYNLASGVYLYRIQIGEYNSVKKMLLLK